VKHERLRSADDPDPARDPIANLMEQAAALGARLDVEGAKKVLAYEDLLRTRAVPVGIVGRADSPSLRERHILDSLRAAATLGPADSDAYDLGAGAGLPGIVVSIARPDLRMGLVEPRRSRAAFLEMVVERLALTQVSVLQTRAERLSAQVDVCFARALRSLSTSWQLAEPLLKPGGRLVYFASRRGAEQIVVPPGTTFRLVETSVLDSSGPLVIMTRR
jgi:16S rRNA (guanine527-N7)-methyltransferase